MTTRQRPADTGAERGRYLRNLLGRELRQARIDRGLTQRGIGRAVGLSGPQVSRIERADAPAVSVGQLAQLLAVVGLELSAGAYPGGQAIRDEPQVRLLARFKEQIHPSLRWSTEVPLPGARDQRAWDAMVWLGSAWRYGVEAETGPRDSQALIRRLRAKERDGSVDGVILVLPSTRRTRDFLAAARSSLEPAFPIDGRRALGLLSSGSDPGGSAIVVI